MKTSRSQRNLLLTSLALFGGGITTGLYFADTKEGLPSMPSLIQSAQAQEQVNMNPNPRKKLNSKYLFTYSVELFPPQFIPNGPKGDRLIFPTGNGMFEGPEIRGVIIPPGADWSTARSDGTIGIDVRLTFVTDDDVNIFVTYNGVAAPNDAGSIDIQIAPTFQVDAESEYSYLNNIQAFGIGKPSENLDLVTYDVYQILETFD